GQEAWSNEKIVANTLEKIKLYDELQVKFAEFGTRRRHSYRTHRVVMNTLSTYKGDIFTGSSNVHMAMLHHVKPIGTHAHEWFMYHAAEYVFKMANSMLFEHWVYVYRGYIGDVLSDTYTIDEAL